MIKNLNYWVQQTLPLVYDDSLTFYELVNKVVSKLNEVIDSQNMLEEYWEEFNKTFNENLFITVTTILQDWLNNGVFNSILKNYVLEKWTWSVKYFNAKGDGITDDSDAIIATFNACPEGGTIVFPAGTYLVSKPIPLLKNNITILGNKITSKLNSGYFLNPQNDIKNIVIKNFEYDGNTNDMFFGNNSGLNLENITIDSNIIKNVNLGVSFNADLSGQFTRGRISNNLFENIKGTDAGNGYGIHIAGAYNIYVENNIIDNAERHAIYNAWGGNNTFIGNKLINHRKTVYTGDPRPAMFIARHSVNIKICENIFENCYDGMLMLQSDNNYPDSRPEKSGHLMNVNISNNTFSKNLNSVAMIYIGYQNATTPYFQNDIYINNNNFYLSDIAEECTSLNIGAAISFQTGNNVKITSNNFFGEWNTNINFISIDCLALDRIQNLMIKNNVFNPVFSSICPYSGQTINLILINSTLLNDETNANNNLIQLNNNTYLNQRTIYNNNIHYIYSIYNFTTTNNNYLALDSSSFINLAGNKYTSNYHPLAKFPWFTGDRFINELIGSNTRAESIVSGSSWNIIDSIVEPS